MAKKKKTEGNTTPATQPSEDGGPRPIRDGYLIDFISGKPVKDGPEEREAVQVFARMLWRTTATRRRTSRRGPSTA
jgi:hypothetical protein